MADKPGAASWLSVTLSTTAASKHVAERHERLVAGSELDNQRAAIGQYPVALQNGSPFETHIGHMAAEIARLTNAIRSITATALQRKHSFDANHLPIALNPCA